MEELKYVHTIGGRDCPIPYVNEDDTLSEGGKPHLGTLDTTIYVDSNLERDRFIGEFYRNLPSPSLLNPFVEGLVQRSTANQEQKDETGENSPIVETYLGEAGTGKTFMAALSGRLIHEDGAILVDCGAKDLKELLFEVVVDNPEAQTLFEKIDSLLERYNSGIERDKLTPTIELLRKGLGEAFSQENGQVGIDWEKAVKSGILSRPEAQETLDLVAKANNLDRVNASALGLKTQEGPLIRAWKEGRPIILDEYNKNKPGSENALQVVMQVFKGELSRHTVSSQEMSFTFDRRDRKPGFFVTITGNTSSDGESTNVLSGSAYSRMEPIMVGEATQEDWEHRICQALTGVPMSTLWRCDKEVWRARCQEAAMNHERDPFADLCRQIRTAGLSDEEKRRIPQSQLDLIDHYPAVLAAAKQLSEFYIAWSKAIIPDGSRSYMSNPEEKGHTDSIDDEYSRMVGLNLRKAISHISKALRPRLKASKTGSNSWGLGLSSGTPVQAPRRKRYEPLEELGTNLMAVVARNVENTTVGRKSLHDYLETIMIDLGIKRNPNPNVKQGGRKTLEELLNIHIERPEEQYREYAALICDDLRARYPELKKRGDDDIIPPGTFEIAFQSMADNQNADGILVPNIRDLRDFADKPLEMFDVVPVTDAERWEPSAVRQSQVLIAMTFPNSDKIFDQMAPIKQKKGGIREKLMENTFLTKFMKGEKGKAETGNNDQGSKESMEDIQTCVIGAEDGNTLVVRNAKTKSTLLVGAEKISEDLKQALKKQGITYLSTNASAKELNDTFQAVVGDQVPEVLSMMQEGLSSGESRGSGVFAANFAAWIKQLRPNDGLLSTVQFQRRGR